MTARLPVLWIAALLASPAARGAGLAGELTYTTDYIFRGISQGEPGSAGQLDLHYTTADGTFFGVFGTTLRRIYGHGYRGEIDGYLGHRFDLSPTWSTSISATQYSYVAGNLRHSSDYQELAVSLAYLDQWTFTVAASPDQVRYEGRYWLGHYAAYDADFAGQIPLGHGLFATGGLGYYLLQGPAGTGYVYGNAGVAYEYRSLRADLGYYAVQKRAERMFPYGEAVDRVAGTLSWHF